MRRNTLLFALSICMVALPAGTVAAQSDIERLVEQTGIVAARFAMRDFAGYRQPRKVIVLDIGGLHALLDVTDGVELVAVNSEAEAIEHAADADAIIGLCSDRVLAAAPAVTWVQIFSAGAERCLAGQRIGAGTVVLTNMQKMSSPVIAEHAVALLMSLARGLPQYSRTMKRGAWQDDADTTGRMLSLGGKTLLVVGLGGIGTEVARRAAALDMRVIGTRRSSREGPEFVAYVGLADELLKLAGEADVIVSALPLTAETSGIFDARFFAAAKRGALFVNVGRGKSVVTDDLLAALQNGQLGGAGLDVTEPEPLPAGHPLWQLDNVLITPHVATEGGNLEREWVLLQENLRRFVAGEPLLNVVDPDRGY